MNAQPGYIASSESNLEINNNNRNLHQPEEGVGHENDPKNSDKGLPIVRKSSISNGMLSPRENDTPNDFA